MTAPVRTTSHDMAPRSYTAGAALLTLLAFVGTTLWSFSTPYFHGPDEVEHVNSVHRVMAGGGWPEPYEAEILAGTWQAVAEADSRRYSGVYRIGPPIAPAPPGERSALEDPTVLEDRLRDQMVQHSPAYYYVVGGVTSLFGGTSLAWDHALTIMRLCSAFFVAAAFPFLIGIGRRLTDSRNAGLVGGAAVLAIPFFSTMGGYVSNDTLLVPTCTAALYFMVRAWTAAPDRAVRFLAAAGLALGLALLTKGLALILIPPVAIMAAVIAARAASWPRRALLWLLPLGTAFVVGGWWWARNLLVLGVLQPSQFGAIEDRDEGPGPENYDIVFFTRAFVVRFLRLFWGRGVRADIAYPNSLVLLATLGVLLALAVAVVVARRRWLLLLLLVYPALITVTIFNNAHGIYVDLGIPDRGVQGRYTYSGIAAFSAVFAAAWAGLFLTARRPVALGRVLARVVVGGFVAVAVAGWVWVFGRLWGAGIDGWGGALSSATTSAGTASATIPALAVGYLVIAAAVVVVVGRIEPADRAEENAAEADVVEPDASGLNRAAD